MADEESSTAVVEDEIVDDAAQVETQGQLNDTAVDDAGVDAGVEQIQQPAAPSFLDRLKSSGIPVQGDTEDAALESLANSYRQLQAAAAFGYQARPQWNQFQEWQRQAAGQQAAPQQLPPQQPQKREPKFKPLEYDPQWESFVTRDEQGNLVPKSQYVDPTVPQKLLAYQTGLRERLAAFANDPETFFNDTYRGSIEELVSQAIEQRMAASQYRQDDRQFASQVLQQYLPQFVVTDANGQPVIDPSTGQRQLKPEGHIYANAVAEAAQMGISDSRVQHRMAMGALKEFELTRNGHANGAANGAANGNAPAGDKKKTFLDRMNPANTRTPNRNGTIRQSDRTDFSQNPSKTLLQQMLQDARQQGLNLEEQA